MQPYKRSCQEIYEANSSATDGEYTIDIDGYNGPMPPMTVSCELSLQEQVKVVVGL